MTVPAGYRPLHLRGEFDGHTLAFASFPVDPDSVRPRDRKATPKVRKAAQDAARNAAMQFVWDLPQVQRVEVIAQGVYQFHRVGRDAKGREWACIVPSRSGMAFTVEYWKREDGA